MECERCQGGGQIVKYLGCDDGCYEWEPCPDCDGTGKVATNG
jgi:DnaJ-class molecular chaperone